MPPVPLRNPHPLFMALLALGATLGYLGPTALGLADYARALPITTPTGFSDGVHRGSYTFPLPPGAIAMARHWEVQVTTSGGLVTEILPLEPASYDADPLVLPTLIQRIKDSGSLEVDGVSGSTVTSKSFLKAVENALLD